MPIVGLGTGLAAFATSSDLAVLLQRTFSAEESAAAELQLDLASAAIRNYTRQTISEVVADTVALRSTTRGTLVLPERPVSQVTLVRQNELTIAAASYSLVGDELQWGANVLNIGNLAESAGGWGSAAVVEVTYTHGFATIPDDIKGVCLSLAERAMNGSDGMQSETIGNYSYQAMARLLQDDEKTVLNRYRKRYR